jgi:hypothetical protein
MVVLAAAVVTKGGKGELQGPGCSGALLLRVGGRRRGLARWVEPATTPAPALQLWSRGSLWR